MIKDSRKMCGLKRGVDVYLSYFPVKKNGKKAHCEVVLVVWDLIIGRSMSFIFLSLGVSCNSCEMGFS